MKNSSPLSTYGRSLWIGLIIVLLLTGCSGNSHTPSEALAARQAVLSAQNELPKSANQNPAAGVPAAKQIAPGQAQPEALQPVTQAPAGAPAPQAAQNNAPATSLPDAAKPAPAVDLSLPVEPRVGARAPAFTLQTLDGRTMDLASLAGSPVVISYWATWCVPCKKELPILQKLAQEYSQRGLVVLTVNATDQDDMAKVQAAVGEMGMTFPVLLDQGKAFASTYNAAFFPSTFFIDASGVIRDIKLGDTNEADLRAKIENLLAVQ
jgi:peroxiredoxin